MSWAGSASGVVKAATAIRVAATSEVAATTVPRPSTARTWSSPLYIRRAAKTASTSGGKNHTSASPSDPISRGGGAKARRAHREEEQDGIEDEPGRGPPASLQEETGQAYPGTRGGRRRGPSGSCSPAPTSGRESRASVSIVTTLADPSAACAGF